MTSTPSPAPRSAAHHAPNTFITRFVPGLILGLLVGGLAGAFLAPIAEQGIGGGGAPAGRIGARSAPTLIEGSQEQRELLPRQDTPSETSTPTQPTAQPPTQPK